MWILGAGCLPVEGTAVRAALVGLDEERRLSRGVKHGLAELGVVELAVEALTGHELPVGAAFHHVAIPHH